MPAVPRRSTRILRRHHRTAATPILGVALVTLLAAASSRADAAEGEGAADPAPTQPGLEPAPAVKTPVTDPPIHTAAARRFGGKGQVILDGLLGYRLMMLGGNGAFGLINASRSCQTYAGSSTLPIESCTTAVSLSPSIEVGIGRGFTLGGTLSASLMSTTSNYPKSGPGSSTSSSSEGSLFVGVNPRLGYVVPVNEDFVLWPRVGGTIAASVGGAYLQPMSAWAAIAELGLVFRAGRYVFLNVDPQLMYGRSKWTNPESATGGRYDGTMSGVNVGISAGLGLVLGS